MNNRQIYIQPKYLDFFFNGKFSHIIGFDVEKAVSKKGIFSENYKNIPVEISLSSDLNNYECFFHCYIFQKPEIIHSYNTWITGINRFTLKNAPNFLFVKNQLNKFLYEFKPLLIGCSIKNDLSCLNIKYENYFDIQNFFYEFNNLNTGFQPISLKRIVKKFFNFDIHNQNHDCITDSRYTLIVYKEIILEWEKIKKLYNLMDPPFENNIFEK